MPRILSKSMANSYSLFHRFRLGYRDDYFEVNFDHFLVSVIVREASRAVAKSDSSLIRTTINKFSLLESVKHTVEKEKASKWLILHQNALRAKTVLRESKGELIFPGKVNGGADRSIERPSLSRN